jgi:hypothetical protein
MNWQRGQEALVTSFEGVASACLQVIRDVRTGPGVRQPVHRDVVEDVVSREAFALSVEDAGNELITARVMVADAVPP